MVFTQLRIFQKEIKSTLNQELMHTPYIRRKRIISESGDYNLKSETEKNLKILF